VDIVSVIEADNELSQMEMTPRPMEIGEGTVLDIRKKSRKNKKKKV